MECSCSFDLNHCTRASSPSSFSPTNINSSCTRKLWSRKSRLGSRISARSGDSKHSASFLAKAKNLFAQEVIGAEHGEAFETFRPDGLLKVDVDFLNNMCERGLNGMQNGLKPEESFGLIFSWDNVVLRLELTDKLPYFQKINTLYELRILSVAETPCHADTQTLRMDAWEQLAEEEGRSLPDDAEIHREILLSGVEHVICKVLCWEESEMEVERLKVRLAEIFYEKLSQLQAPMDGLNEWLEALYSAGVPCAVASSLDRQNLLAALERMGLENYFEAIVSDEDGMETLAQRFLSAAVKLGRPPYKCVVFEDDPRGITAAHNCTMMAVAVIGSHPAYELVQADLAVGSFSELSVINLRRLFANEGFKFMDLKKQDADRKNQQRKIRTDMMDPP